MEEKDDWWERREILKLGGDGGFDWIVETSSRDNSKAQHETDRTTGRWQIVGESNGPHYLQLITGEGDMYSFAAIPGRNGEYLLDNKSWQRSPPV